MKRLVLKEHGSISERSSWTMTPQKLSSIKSFSMIRQKHRENQFSDPNLLILKNKEARRNIKDILRVLQLNGLGELHRYIQRILKLNAEGCYDTSNILPDILALEESLNKSLEEIKDRLTQQPPEKPEMNRKDRRKNSSLRLAAKKKAWEIETTLLKEEIKDLRNNADFAKSGEHFNRQIKLLKQEKSELEKESKAFRKLKSENNRQFIKFQYEVGQLKYELSEKQKHIDTLNQSNLELRQAISELMNTNDKLTNENNISRENLGMLSEDYMHLVSSKTSLESIIFKNRSNLIKNVENNEFVGDLPLSNALVKDLKKFILARSHQNLDSQQKNENSMSEFDPLKSLRHIYPPISEFLRDEEDRDQFIPPFKNWVQSYIKAIYDSKFKEHLYYNKNGLCKPSSFLAFVYAWMHSFKVDSSGKISRADSSLFNEFLFYISVAPPSSWEISIFKQFANEEFKIDELDFFLKMRHLLIKDTKNEVSTLKVFELINKTMNEFPPQEISRLKTFIKKKSVDHKIDHSIALRALLEYYRLEKHLKYNTIKILFPENNPCFKEFSEICAAVWKGSRETDIVELYRECWKNKDLTPEGLFTAGNENGWFLKMVVVKFHDLEFNLQLAKDWSHNSEKRENAQVIVESLGIPSIVNEHEKYEFLISQAISENTRNIGVWRLDQLYENYWDFIQGVQILASYA